MISADTSVLVRYLVGTPAAQARRAAGLIGLVQRENVRVLGLRIDTLVATLVRARSQPGRPIPDAMIVAAAVAADALPLATFDREQRRYGVAVREP